MCLLKFFFVLVNRILIFGRNVRPLDVQLTYASAVYSDTDSWRSMVSCHIIVCNFSRYDCVEGGCGNRA